MVLTADDAPQWLKDESQWLKDESLRKKWAELNNARLRVWTIGDAPAWISAKWKREEWAQKKNSIEASDLTYIIPCICDKCGAEFVGIEWKDRIWAELDNSRMVGIRRRAIHSETDCVLCASCFERLRQALQEFEKRWVKDGD